MPYFLLRHQHAATECGGAFGAWTDSSPLRHRCARLEVPRRRSSRGGAWRPDIVAALELLPRFAPTRTSVSRVRDVEIP